MLTRKKIGIWMDHSGAHLTEFTQSPMRTQIIESKFTSDVKEQGLSKSESHMHSKEKHLQSDYYKKIAEVIIQYKEILLFGPTDAKVELFNILKADHQFATLKIEIKQTDKMTENQEHAFVKDYFSKQILAL